MVEAAATLAIPSNAAVWTFRSPALFIPQIFIGHLICGMH